METEGQRGADDAPPHRTVANFDEPRTLSGGMSYRIARFTALIALVVMSVVAGLMLLAASQEDAKFAEAHWRELASSLLDIVDNDAARFDYASLNEIVATFGADERVRFIQVSDRDGFDLATHGTPGTDSSVITLTGTVTTLRLEHENSSLASLSTQTVVAMILLPALGIALLAYIVHRYTSSRVVIPVEQATRAVDNYPLGVWNRLPETGYREIAALSQGLNRMADSISSQTDRLQEMNSQLRHQVAATNEARAALSQAERLKAVGELSAGLAHDFNNLLGIILGSLDLIRVRLPESADTSGVDAATAAATRAGELTRKMLAFGREIPLSPKVVDLADLLSSLAPVIEQALPDSIDFVLEPVHEDAAVAFVDGVELERAILNLCVNARDAMPDGGDLTLSCQALVVEDATSVPGGVLGRGDYVLICVEDSGTGITDDVLEKMYEPFYSTKPASLGSGLGLSSVFGFALQSGGAVRVQTTVGSGSRFDLLVPANRTAYDASPSLTRPNAIQDPGQEADVSTNRHALVVEDEPAERAVLAGLLAELGYVVRTCADGEQAVQELMSTRQFDLVLSDVELPGAYQGAEVLSAARQQPGLRVLMISGKQHAQLSGLIQNDDQALFALKPLSLDALRRALVSLNLPVADEVN